MVIKVWRDYPFEAKEVMLYLGSNVNIILIDTLVINVGGPMAPNYLSNYPINSLAHAQRV